MNKAVIDTFAKQGNEAVEEFGRLDVYIKAFAYNKDGHELMRMEIHSWYHGSAADKDSTPRARITSCMWAHDRLTE